MRRFELFWAAKILTLFVYNKHIIDHTPMRVQPRHLLLGPVARVPPRHLGLDVRDELRPRAADDGVRALRARDAEALLAHVELFILGTIESDV